MLEVPICINHTKAHCFCAAFHSRWRQGRPSACWGPPAAASPHCCGSLPGWRLPSRGRSAGKARIWPSVPAHRRGFGLVFQDYALFPHMNVVENVAFGLKMQGLSAAETELRVTNVLEKVNLAGFKAPARHGSFRRRTTAAWRWHAPWLPDPHLLMFDEPLGALDRSLREQLDGRTAGHFAHQRRSGYLRHP